MSDLEHANPKFLKSLGTLFYAVATADSDLNPYEDDKFRAIIKENGSFLLPNNDSRLESLSPKEEIYLLIAKGFDNALGKKSESREAFRIFQEYYQSHADYFTAQFKNWIVDTSYAIANASAGVNKSELILITQLKLLFWKNK